MAGPCHVAGPGACVERPRTHAAARDHRPSVHQTCRQRAVPTSQSKDDHHGVVDHRGSVLFGVERLWGKVQLRTRAMQSAPSAGPHAPRMAAAAGCVHRPTRPPPPTRSSGRRSARSRRGRSRIREVNAESHEVRRKPSVASTK